MCGDGVEETEERRFPLGSFSDSLALLANAVVETRIEMARTAGAEVELKAAVRRRRDLHQAPYVVRQHAHLRLGGDEQFAKRFRGFENSVDQRIVADVRP